MNFHIIIPTHKRNDLLKVLLDSLVVIDLISLEGKLTATVVENGSHVSEELVARYEGAPFPIKYRHLEQGNKSAALNAVIKETASDTFLLFFDDDVILDAGIITAYVKAIATFGDQYFYGGPVRGYYDEEPAPYLLKYLPESAGSFVLPQWTEPTDISKDRSTMLGANWGILASVLLTNGTFDPQVGPGSKKGIRGQETDAMRRLVSAGIKPVYVPGAEVQHYVPAKVLTEEWLVDRFTKTFTYAGSRRKTPTIIGRELARLVLSYGAKIKGEITGQPEDVLKAKITAAKSRGFFAGLGHSWLTKGL
ncbi:glycosyltransferase family 2 protein [Lewinella sp. 4G2]|uniref:glycosyltransferase family 2 protein n=1 Tax=Lewinella sp. 4G2 TaxID=1803372 RepID=UPI0007B47FDE|nr:glycosyltransferase [Lewinella sp. 4G2]OAV44296.1 hypothetical protein A3850_007225 [Lewinella sp. 4G2]